MGKKGGGVGFFSHKQYTVSVVNDDIHSPGSIECMTVCMDRYITRAKRARSAGCAGLFILYVFLLCTVFGHIQDLKIFRCDPTIFSAEDIRGFEGGKHAKNCGDWSGGFLKHCAQPTGTFLLLIRLAQYPGNTRKIIRRDTFWKL